MTIEIILISFCCVICFANLFATIFLSNFIFRVLSDDRKISKTPPIPDDKGLVDLNYSPTYDPRFRGG